MSDKYSWFKGEVDRALLDEVSRLRATSDRYEELARKWLAGYGQCHRSFVHWAIEDSPRQVSILAALLRRVAEEAQCHHGWRGASAAERISTPCPTCGLHSLFIGFGGHLTCASVPSDHTPGCPQPGVETAVELLKSDLASAREQIRQLRDSISLVLQDIEDGCYQDSTVLALRAALAETAQPEEQPK